MEKLGRNINIPELLALKPSDHHTYQESQLRPESYYRELHSRPSALQVGSQNSTAYSSAHPPSKFIEQPHPFSCSPLGYS